MENFMTQPQTEIPAEDSLLDNLPDMAPAPKAKKKKKWLSRVIALTILLAALSVGGVLAYRTWFAPAETVEDNSPREYTVAMGDIRVSYDADGTVALPYAFLDASYTAELLELRVEVGDSFKAGDILAVLEDTTLQDAVTLKQEALESAQESVKSAKNSITDAQNSLDSAKRSLSKQEISYQESILSVEDKKTSSEQSIAAQKQTIEDVKTQLESAKKLLNAMEVLPDEYSQNEVTSQKNTVAGLEYKLSTEQENLRTLEKNASREDTSVQNASLTLADAEDNVSKAQTTVSRAYDTLSSAEKKVEKAQSELEEAIEDLEEAYIIAPFDGVIAAINREVGDNVPVPATPSATASLFVYRKAGKAYTATASIPEADIQSVYEGQAVEITIDAWSDETLKGKVKSISNLAGTGSNNVITYTATVEFDTSEEGIRDQMNCGLTFITKDVPGVVKVNNDALLSENGKTYVTVKLADGGTEKREVKTGFSDGSVTEITNGLSVGETILSQTLTGSANSRASNSNQNNMTQAMPGMGGATFFVSDGGGRAMTITP